ncbi:MAG: beta-N-acetylhexosaminidase [Clostridia bacterium]|nr:beta-N-acetylhexosaminidase [Clostridia bacterium]
MSFRRFGTMIDCSRNAVLKPEKVKEWIDISADLGYNALMLYTEDTYEIEGHPYFGHLRGRYSGEELRDLDSYAAQKGVELIPCIQTLAHLNAIFEWSVYNDIRDCNDILLAENEKTYALIDAMFASLAKNFTTKTVHIGMDEAHMIGRGKYQDIHGFVDRSEILVHHLQKVSALAEKYGFTLMMWGDMFIRLINGGEYYGDCKVDDTIRAKVPQNVQLVYWDYYSTDTAHYEKQIQVHNAIKDETVFAGGLWCWTGFAPRNDYSMRATAAALAACKAGGVSDVFLTLWGDDGGECSRFATLPSLYYAAAVRDGITDIEEIKAGFLAKYGIPFEDFRLLDLPDTPNDRAQSTHNPEKYMLYNDCLMGKMDALIAPQDGAEYAACAKKLRAVQAGQFAYLFDAAAALCDVLAIKADLGLRTRKAYLDGNHAVLAALVPMYSETKIRIEAFYTAYRTQWMTENKPHGFDVQDIRLGGLIRRVAHCQERIEQYLNGEISRIEELEEPVLHLRGKGENTPPETVCHNRWGAIASANVVTW